MILLISHLLNLSYIFVTALDGTRVARVLNHNKKADHLKSEYRNSLLIITM